MVCDSERCLPEAKFPVQSSTSFYTIDSSLIRELMKHDFCAEAVGSEQEQDDFNLPENLEAQ